MKASDYEKEECYTSASKRAKTQHKKEDCRYLKNSTVIKTNRREAYQKGVKTICVWCWWD